MAQTDKPLFIVGIGASAGGLHALQQLFANMPADSGMAFVVIQHLSPDFKSQMDDLLSSHTTMAIHQVAHNMPLEANNIYLNVSMTQMEIRGGDLLLTEIARNKHVDLPIDVFFKSLAQEVGAQAVGVVLSGTGSDGSEGIRAIHEGGGLVLAQSPDSSQFDAMPQSAVDTGVCDFVLPPQEIPALLLEHAGVERSFGELWRHFLRWAVTVRDLRPGGHVGSVITHPLPLALLALVFARDTGLMPLCAALVPAALAVRLLVRRAMARATDRACGRTTGGRRHAPIPLWCIAAGDMLGFMVYGASLFARSIEWRGARLTTNTQGRISARD